MSIGLLAPNRVTRTTDRTRRVDLPQCERRAALHCLYLATHNHRKSISRRRRRCCHCRRRVDGFAASLPLKHARNVQSHPLTAIKRRLVVHRRSFVDDDDDNDIARRSSSLLCASAHRFIEIQF